SAFLSSANLSNLLMESSAVGVIALGVVCVLLVGEIDLSVGSVSGLAASILAASFVKHGWPIAAAIAAAILAGSLIGAFYAQFHSRFGVPSFVISLAGLLGFLGVQLKTLGKSGTVNLPFDSFIVKLGQLWFVPSALSYVLVVLAVLAFLATRYMSARARRKADLSAPSDVALLSQAAIIVALLLVAVWYLNQARGIGWMFVIFVSLVLALHYGLTRPKWGRSVYAVGGNAEAARRALRPIRPRIAFTGIDHRGAAPCGGLVFESSSRHRLDVCHFRQPGSRAALRIDQDEMGPLGLSRGRKR